ncbi:MAG: insulinase family protein [Planctomycetes bacterium]|nr:insulinase family protein [Planctomycetota bacterium]
MRSFPFALLPLIAALAFAPALLRAGESGGAKTGDAPPASAPAERGGAGAPQPAPSPAKPGVAPERPKPPSIFDRLFGRRAGGPEAPRGVGAGEGADAAAGGASRGVDRRGGDIAPHPSKLTFPPLKFTPPKPGEFRVKLKSGAVLYVAEDHELPTLDVTVTIRAGNFYHNERESHGLAEAVGALLRSGGAGRWSREQMDEELDFAAASLATSIGDDQATVSLSCLMKDAPLCLEMLGAVLRDPRFDAEEVRKHKARTIEGLGRRNDSPPEVLAREFEALAHPDHPMSWNVRKPAVEAITRERLLAFHQAWFSPGNTIWAISGDFDAKDMAARVEALLAGWTAEGAVKPRLPAPPGPGRPGLYLIEKETNQGYVAIGHSGIKRDNPDYHAVQVMNFIFGGGSFTSRIMSRVRSDEGLAYSVYSRVGAGDFYEGTMEIGFQSKSATVAYAAKIILEEVRRIQSEPATDQEMESAKSALIERFPSFFPSRKATMDAFAALDYYHRPRDWFDTYRDRIAAVTKEDVMRVATAYLRPDQFTVVVVGKSADLLAGDNVHDASLPALFGKPTVLPLRDPLGSNF